MSHPGCVKKINSNTKLKRANYTAALDVGDMNEKIIKVETLYLADEIMVYNYPKNKTDFMSFFDQHSSEMEDYIKDYKLKFKNKEDAQKILNQYDSLML